MLANAPKFVKSANNFFANDLNISHVKLLVIHVVGHVIQYIR